MLDESTLKWQQKADMTYKVMSMHACEYVTVQLLLWSIHTRCEYSNDLNHDAALLSYKGGAFLTFLTCNVTYMRGGLVSPALTVA